MKTKSAKTFEGYLKQAVEDLPHRKITTDEFKIARYYADKTPADSMQKRIELIAKYVW